MPRLETSGRHPPPRRHHARAAPNAIAAAPARTALARAVPTAIAGAPTGTAALTAAAPTGTAAAPARTAALARAVPTGTAAAPALTAALARAAPTGTVAAPARTAALATAVSLALAIVTAAPAALAAEGQARWVASLAAVSATPPVLASAVSVGAAAEVDRQLGDGPLFVSARIAWLAASAANQAWVIEHRQLLAAAGVGAAGALGVGRFWIQGGGGASGVHEQLGRHQRLRIEAAGVPGATVTTLVFGPHAFAEAGLALRLRGAVSVLVAAGPTLARTRVGGRARWRVGAGARLGAAVAF
jgi:hypothetical protein